MPQKSMTAAQAPVPAIPVRTSPPRAGEADDGLTLTVIVCSYTLDRWGDMTAALDSIRRQVRTADELILVVDHCPALAARARAVLPGIRVVASRGQPGLSGARNTGIAEARGAILAFLDDDAVADPHWTRRLLACYSNKHVLGVGGRIQPCWDSHRPVWFPAEFDWVIGCTYRGMPEVRSPVRNFLGANMSFRREVLASDGGFRSDLGRGRGRPLGCEETELCIRAAADNPESVLLYEPDATVRHRVPQQRATWSYFRARCFAEGLSKAAMVRQTGARQGLSTERSYVWSTIPSALLRPPRGDDRHPWLATVPAVVAGVVVTAVGYFLGRLRVLREVRIGRVRM
jgi:GT2 family glycosyltransferase